jgi:hypothetical protein
MYRSPPASTIGGSSKYGPSIGTKIAIAVLATAVGVLLIFIFVKKKGYFNRHVPPSSDPPAAEPVNMVACSSAPAEGPDRLSRENVLQSAEIPELDTVHLAELHATGRVQ